MPLANAEWTRETSAGYRGKGASMNNRRWAIAVGCAVAGFIVLDGFGMLCTAQPARAEVNDRQQFLEWCRSNELDISSELMIRGCSEVIRAGTETPKNLAFAFNNRGNGYVFRRDYDQAIADYTEAIKRDPDFVTAYLGRAGVYSDQGDVDRAVADYMKVRRIALKNTDDRTVSELQRGHTPAITLVNLESPIPAAPLLGSDRADNAAAPATATVGQPDFLFGDSNVRHLTRAELQKLSAEQLQIARNEIFARRGRYFKDDRLSSYFAKFAWYQPAAWDVLLNSIEKANVDLIRSLEGPLAPHSVVSRPVPSTKPRSGDKVIRAANLKPE